METLRPPTGATRPIGEGTVQLPLAPASARLARQHARSFTGDVEDPRIALVITELVTNAVVHAHSAPVLRIEREGRALRIEVFDDGPGNPRMRPLGDEPVSSGRGLALVDRVADSWGVIASDGALGKTVWAVVTPD